MDHLTPDGLSGEQKTRERRQEQLRLRQELDYAREIQLSMLPLANPELDWLDIASLSLPATEVGGDYYDYFAIDDDRLAVVAGDVAGHGFAAGLLLASVRGCLTLLVEEIDRPQAVMSKLNHMVKQTTRRRMLVSLAILSLDRTRGRATLTSAAYPPVLIRRAADGSVEELDTSSLPLGALLREKFAHRDVPFAAGDVFLLYTDGLYETEDEAGEVYGLERLSGLLAAQDSGTADEIREAILTDVWNFKGRAVQTDDVTFVVLKIKGR